ncbi:hypothetical protein TrRE_jg3307 [Triparma retinervis]|uniref:Uncharacterized protein n=1 Tax=Triparma retinervis TaxID=2557542 RepID=A0A9W6ZXV4_9STRA|nr:hypothetical protein TrRE_jg3307 [Triparma retinervis]
MTVNVTDVNLTLAESYYTQALSLWPENCGAMGYLAELYMSQEWHEMALFTLEQLCSECGASHDAASYAKELVEAAAGITLPDSCVAVDAMEELGGSGAPSFFPNLFPLAVLSLLFMMIIK